MVYILIFIFVLIIFLFIKKALKGPVRTVEQLKRPIEDLLTRGFDGGFLIIDHAKSEKFLQLSKYVVDSKKSGIELGFPKADWSEGFYDDLKEYCLSRNLDFREDIPQGENELFFININFNDDSDLAFRTVKEVLANILRVGLGETFYVRLVHASHK